MEIQNVLPPLFFPPLIMKSGSSYVKIKKTKQLHSCSVLRYESQGLGAKRWLVRNSFPSLKIC